MKRILNKTCLLVAVIILSCGYFPAKADFWGELGKGLAKGLANGLNQAAQLTEQQMVQQVLDNPAKQSQEMKQYLNHIKTGNSYYAQGEYAAAWGSYRNANIMGQNATDYYLKLAYNKYGQKAELERILQICWNASGSGSESSIDSYSSSSGSYNSGSSSYSSGSSSSSGTTCRKCHGNKICTRCNGSGVEFSTTYGVNKYITCPACSGSKKCSLCGGTGR